jgi:hypothetical protein
VTHLSDSLGAMKKIEIKIEILVNLHWVICKCFYLSLKLDSFIKNHTSTLFIR